MSRTSRLTKHLGWVIIGTEARWEDRPVIRVLCPHCKRRYRTITEVMGREAVCHNCHVTFIIGQERPPFQWKQTDLAEDSWIGYVPPEKPEEIKHCIMCDAPLPSGSVRCPACGANQVTGIVHRSRGGEQTEERPERPPVGSLAILHHPRGCGPGRSWNLFDHPGGPSLGRRHQRGLCRAGAHQQGQPLSSRERRRDRLRPRVRRPGYR